MVTTVHGFSSPAILPVYQRYDDIAHYVSISDADRSPLLHYAATIHHGIELDRFTYAPGPGAYCCSSAGSTPTREPTAPFTSLTRPESLSSSPGSSRTMNTSRRWCALTSTARRSATSDR